MKIKIYLVTKDNETVAVYDNLEVVKKLLPLLEQKLDTKLEIKEFIVNPHIDYIK